MNVVCKTSFYTHKAGGSASVCRAAGVILLSLVHLLQYLRAWAYGLKPASAVQPGLLLVRAAKTFQPGSRIAGVPLFLTHRPYPPKQGYPPEKRRSPESADCCALACCAAHLLFASASFSSARALQLCAAPVYPGTGALRRAFSYAAAVPGCSGTASAASAGSRLHPRGLPHIGGCPHRCRSRILSNPPAKEPRPVVPEIASCTMSPTRTPHSTSSAGSGIPAGGGLPGPAPAASNTRGACPNGPGTPDTAGSPCCAAVL